MDGWMDGWMDRWMDGWKRKIKIEALVELSRQCKHLKVTW